MIADLERAATSLEKGQTAEALASLLSAWREKRATELADAIDALAHAFPAAKLEGDTNAAWMALARGGDAGDIYGLLATLIEAGPVSALGGRVESLAERPADPRIALAFANVALEPPTTSSSNFPVWTKLFACIEKTGDARVVPILEKRKRMKPGASNFWPKLASWIERALEKVPPAPALTKAEAAAVAGIARAAKKAKPATRKAVPKPAPARKPASGDPLARAKAAVAEGDLPACIDALLDGWRERPFAQYAAAIDRVTALHDEGVAGPGGSDKELEKAWQALAAKRRAIDVGRLAETAGDGKVGDADKRLEQMMTWPSDPRIARWMFQHCISNAFSDRARTWSVVADLLVKNVDVRLAPELEGFAETRGENKARRSAMRRAGPAALKAIAAVPEEPSHGELVAFDALNAALDGWDAKRPITERRMLEAIAAAPDDHGPALVYADWLTERGHPRGELIVLQCSESPDQARLTELIAQNTRALLGTAACLPYSVLAHVTGAGSFRRGLLRKIELRYDPPRWFYEGSPMLWFLEEIEPGFGGRGDDTALAVAQASRSLRSMKASPRLAARLAESKTPLSLERLQLSYAREAEAPMATLLDGIAGPGLSRVKHLELFWSNGVIHQDAIPDALVASPLFANLESLAVATTNLAGVLETLKRHGRTLPRLSFLRRYYLDYRLDVALDAKLAPTGVFLHQDGEDRAAEIDKDRVMPLIEALASLRLPAKTKLTLGSGVSFAGPAKTAVSKVIAL